MMSEERKKLPFVSIVIPTLNMKEDIIKCLRFLRRLNYSKKYLEVIVWDNGSENLGVYTSRDELFKRVNPDTDYVLSIDDDVFLPSDSLNILIKYLQDHFNAGIIGPRTVYDMKPNKTAHGAGFVNLWAGRYSDADTGSLVECDYVIGCCMLIKKKVISDLKGFDRDYYTSHGEVDFCLRAKKKGYKIFYDPGVIVRHNIARGGTKTLERIYYLYRNKLLVIRKNASLLQKVTSFPLYTIFWIPKMIMDSILFHRGIKLNEWLIMFKAVRHAIINHVGKVDL